MNKFALWLLVGVVAWFAWQAWRRAQRASLEREAREAGRVAGEGEGGSDERLAEPIVRCARCGVHLPASEALPDGDAVYCGPAHRDADRAASRTDPR